MNLFADWDKQSDFNQDFVAFQQKQEITTHGYYIMRIAPQTTIDILAEMLDRFERTFFKGD